MHEKSPKELLQVLNDVIAHLDESHRINVRDEPDEVTGPRIWRFLATLKLSLIHI